MAIFDKQNNVYKIPAFNKTKVFDVTGAGDTVVAAYSLALAAKMTPYEAAFVANIAASIVIREFGCATTNIQTICEKN
ncbi:MAG: PfkB family carbohydrate kinase [Candidatus Melainabacteria bacterium]|nr:MAG: PfkB family carbohydrate kinase [Candidatus Melainabacteria bacterium]